MIRFSYIWQVFTAAITLGVIGCVIWAIAEGDAYHAWLFGIYVLVLAVHFSLGFMWRSTARSNARTDKILADLDAKYPRKVNVSLSPDLAKNVTDMLNRAKKRGDLA